MQTFEIGVGDTGPSITEFLTYDNGDPVPDNAANVVHFLLYSSSGVLIFDRAATLVDAATGKVRYDWQAGDTLTGGTFFRRWRVTLATGQIVTVPTERGLDGYPVEIVDPTTRTVTGRLVCSPWCTPADVVECAPCRAANFDPSDMLNAIDISSDILYLLAGKQFPGLCTDTIRPARVYLYGGRLIGSTSITGEAWGLAAVRPDYISDRGIGIAEILLPAFPVVSITQVRVNGVVLDPSAYVINDDRWLMRTDGGSFPIPQDYALPATEVGTAEIVYVFGAAVPPAGRRGSAAYACQILKSWNNDPTCTLPPKTQSAVRQGLSTRSTVEADYTNEGRTGCDEADRFLAAVNPNKLQENSVVLSPDVNWPAHRQR